jgi:lipoprotein-anchoring transpeptidase ErfK/SrfK
MSGRTLRVVLFTFAVAVMALASALGAVALTVGGNASAAAMPRLVEAASAQQRASAQAVARVAADASCHCQAQQRTVPPPPPPPPPPAPGVTPLIYAGTPQPLGGAPNLAGKVVLVSIAQQWEWGYQDGKLMLGTPVTTGMPQLPTPTGVFNVYWKVEDTTFISPWPQGSPFYYSPEHVNYALLFRDGGFYLHDAPWRHCFGPGTNVPHTCGDGAQETGSHGCVNMPTPAGAWLYAWAPYGTTVIIR